MNKKPVYADYAATSVPDPEALQTFIDFSKEFFNPSQPYSASSRPKKILENSREKIAEIIGACPDEIIFTSGGTESDNMAIFSLDHPSEIAVSNIEHKAILEPAKILSKSGTKVQMLKADRDGIISKTSLEGIKPQLVSVMTANNETGTIEPIRELSDSVHKYGAIFHTDAVQAIGHIPINVKDLDVDILSASAHKFGGIRGSGFLYVKRGIPFKPLHYGGGQEKGRRSGTENPALAASMAKALENSVKELENNGRKLREIENIVIQELEGMDFILNGGKNRLPGYLSLSFPDQDGERLLHIMDLYGVLISTGSACSGHSHQTSHVIKALQVPERYASGTIRISFGRNSTRDHAFYTVNMLKKALKRTRK